MTYNKQQHSNLTKLYVNITEIILMLCVPCIVQKLIYKHTFTCTKTCTHPTSVSRLMFWQASTQHKVHTYNIIRTQPTFGFQGSCYIINHWCLEKTAEPSLMVCMALKETSLLVF